MRICPRCRTPYPDNVGVCGEDDLPLIQRGVVEGAPRSEGILVPGSRVGEYLVESMVGQAGWGAVYTGRHTLLRTPVTLELLRRSLTQDGVALARFVSDLYGVNALGHPAAVRVLAVGELDDGQCYVVTEHADGPTLAEILEREAVLTASATLPIVEQLCDLLERVHAAGILHGGVQPGQVVVLRAPPRPTIRVSGFGALHLNVSAPGRAYLAPEVRQGAAADLRSDIYAVGALLGRLVPFHERLAPVIRQATADQPGDRHGSAAELLAAVSAAVGEPSAWVVELSKTAAAPTGREFGFEGIVTVRTPMPVSPYAPETIEGEHAEVEEEVDNDPVTFRTPPTEAEAEAAPPTGPVLAPDRSLGEVADDELEADEPAVRILEPEEEASSLADALDDLFEEGGHTEERALPPAEEPADEVEPPDEPRTALFSSEALAQLMAKQAPRPGPAVSDPWPDDPDDGMIQEEPTREASLDAMPLEAVPTGVRALGRVKLVKRRVAGPATADLQPAEPDLPLAGPDLPLAGPDLPPDLPPASVDPEESPYLSIEIEGESDRGD